MFDFFPGMFGALVTYGRLFLHKDTPLTDKKLRRTVCMEHAFCMLAWTCLFTLLTNSGMWGSFLRAWAIPHSITGMMPVRPKIYRAYRHGDL